MSVSYSKHTAAAKDSRWDRLCSKGATYSSPQRLIGKAASKESIAGLR